MKKIDPTKNITIAVNVADLATLADLICDRDTGKVPPTTENIGACHDLIIKMMGEHAHKYYAEDDGSERNLV